MTASDIERILDELGGLGRVISTAEPTEKAQVHASLGLRLRDQPDENQVVATADLAVWLVVSEARPPHYRHE